MADLEVRSAEAIRTLVATHELDRAQIARDLHDVVGQALTAVRLHLLLIRKGLTASESALSEVVDAIAVVDTTLRQVRDLAFEIRPSLLDDLGLVAAAQACLTRQAHLAGWVAELRADTRGVVLEPQVEAACFRTLQEALTNVSRHAQASIVDVSITACDGQLVLTVDDDGLGFCAERIMRNARAKRSSLGLLGMHERVGLVGGDLTIQSAPGRGTSLRAEFPIGDNAASRAVRR